MYTCFFGLFLFSLFFFYGGWVVCFGKKKPAKTVVVLRGENGEDHSGASEKVPGGPL